MICLRRRGRLRLQTQFHLLNLLKTMFTTVTCSIYISLLVFNSGRHGGAVVKHCCLIQLDLSHDTAKSNLHLSMYFTSWMQNWCPPNQSGSKDSCSKCKDVKERHREINWSHLWVPGLRQGLTAKDLRPNIINGILIFDSLCEVGLAKAKAGGLWIKTITNSFDNPLN